MESNWGIMKKLFFWFGMLALIFYGTIAYFYVNTQKIMAVSNEIVNTSYKILDATETMVDNLLAMEENEKKYLVLKNATYKEYFQSALESFEKKLTETTTLLNGTKDAVPWEKLLREFRALKPDIQAAMGNPESDSLWIPEKVLDRWIQEITLLKHMEERHVQIGTRNLHQVGRSVLRWGLMGLALSLLAGALGAWHLARSMSRPLNELRRGIRALTHKGSTEPLRILSKDEFGELAFAFNEMIHRLKEEERMRSDFISMLSHEVRNPLTTIRESIRLIEEEAMGPVNDKQKRFLTIARKEADRIADLLKNLLQASRLEADHLEIHPTEIAPRDLVATVVQRLTPVAEAKGVHIQENVADVPCIIADMDHIQQVLLNLVANAIKFSPSGGNVSVEAQTNPENQCVRFSIRDEGPGIPESEQPLVFRKYYRASTFQNRIDGTGLGLHIAKHIVEAHGGRIWVSSKPGKGSAFCFELPCQGG